MFSIIAYSIELITRSQDVWRKPCLIHINYMELFHSTRLYMYRIQNCGQMEDSYARKKVAG